MHTDINKDSLLKLHLYTTHALPIHKIKITIKHVWPSSVSTVTFILIETSRANHLRPISCCKIYEACRKILTRKFFIICCSSSSPYIHANNLNLRKNINFVPFFSIDWKWGWLHCLTVKFRAQIKRVLCHSHKEVIQPLSVLKDMLLSCHVI